MQQALSTAKGPVDYINTHGTSTPVGDVQELKGIREVFGENCPPLASTKSLTGHSLGAAGVHEAIYSLMMLNNNFIAPSINIENLDPEVNGLPVVTSLKENVDLNCVLSNSFGFGGTNATLVMETFNG